MEQIEKFITILKSSMSSNNPPLILKIKLKKPNETIFGKAYSVGMFQDLSPTPITPTNPWGIKKIKDLNSYVKGDSISANNFEMIDIDVNNIETIEVF